MMYIVFPIKPEFEKLPDDEREDMSIGNIFEILEEDNSEYQYQDVIDNDSEVNDNSTYLGKHWQFNTRIYQVNTRNTSYTHIYAMLPQEIQTIAAETISDDSEYESANESSDGENSNYSDEINTTRLDTKRIWRSLGKRIRQIRRNNS